MTSEDAKSHSGDRDQNRVLLIDDDPIQYAYMQDLFALFRRERYSLEWAHSFGQGLVALLSGQFVACLLDYHLGENTGIELLQQARAAHCHTPVILVTGDAGGEIDLDAMDAGATDYLLKSDLNPRMIERSLRYAIRMSQTLQALRDAATHDEVSGLLNRRALHEILKDEHDRAERFKRCFSVTLVDLDHFKRINDTYGHQVGDWALKHVSSLILRELRSIDRIARYGGEEFAIVQVETDLEKAKLTAERIRSRVEENPCRLEEQNINIQITLSAGVATYPQHGASVEELLGAADRALYQAKKDGRNRVIAASRLP